jgi:hypothetical protein
MNLRSLFFNNFFFLWMIPTLATNLKNPKKEHKGESTNWLFKNSIWLINKLLDDKFNLLLKNLANDKFNSLLPTVFCLYEECCCHAWFSYYLSHDRSWVHSTRMDEHLWGFQFSFNTPPPPKFRLLISSIAQICQLHVQIQLLVISVRNFWLADLLLSRLTLLIMIFINWKRWYEMWRFIHTYIYIYDPPICRKQSTIFSISCVRSTVAAKHCYSYYYYYYWLHVSCIPLYLRSDPFWMNSDPRLNLLEKLRSCQQLLLISILLWFHKPIESIVDCNVVVIILALSELLSWI